MYFVILGSVVYQISFPDFCDSSNKSNKTNETSASSESNDLDIDEIEYDLNTIDSESIKIQFYF